MARRRNPNIIITGTPGVGKTSLSELVAEATGLRHISITDVVKDRACHDGWDKERACWIVDEDRLVDALEEDLNGVRGTEEEEAEEEKQDKRRSRPASDGADEDERIAEGGCIVDWHACDLFPEDWIDLVVVLRTSTEVLYDRLQARRYADAKVQENLDAEIMQVLLLEAHDAYAPECVIDLPSDDADQLDANADRIAAWVAQWRLDHPV